MAIPSEAPYHPRPVVPEGKQARILVAEDPYINSFLRTVLQRHGYKVVTGEANQSSNMLREGDLQANLVITNAPEAFIPFASSLPILYIAAGPDYELASRFQYCRVLQKPFHNEDLLNAVEDLSQLVVP